MAGVLIVIPGTILIILVVTVLIIVALVAKGTDLEGLVRGITIGRPGR